MFKHFLAIAIALFGHHAIASETIIYKKAGDRELRLHIEKPAGWKSTDERPAIVFFFGGGWVGGSPEQFRGQSEHFASRGMVGIRVEYQAIARGDKGPPLVCCADAKSAMRYVRGHAAELGIDPTRIAAAGGSAGGHLAAFTAMVNGLDDPLDDLTISCKPDALVLFNPVFNNGPGQWGHARVGDRFREFSPAHNISDAAPPTCVFLGDADKLISVPVLREFEAAMKDAGVRCDAHVYPGAGHSFFNQEPHKSQTLAEADNFLTSLGWLAAVEPTAKTDDASRPNIVYILADDLGYGDLGCYNNESKIPTPHLDRFAAEGMRFTDAHSPSSVCSPTRYALLTGRYAWRTRLQRNVLRPWDVPLIASDRLTVGQLLQQHGYATACIGKWHLGQNYSTTDGKPVVDGLKNPLSNVDFTQPVADGPITRGFDHYFGTLVPNYPPYCFIENDRTVGIPSVPAEGRSFNIPGPMIPGWKLEEILPELTRHAVRWIEETAKTKQPFFLYIPLTSPHYPVVPAPEFIGTSKAGEYGDFVYQTDWSIGQVLDALKRCGVADNTLVIFTSDNGPEVTGEVNPGVYDRVQRFEHRSSGDLRGAKRDAWEGGHRVPFMARWPGRIKASAVSDETMCHVDFMATVAAILGTKLPHNAAEDSVNVLPVLLGEARSQPIREATIHHSAQGKFAVRKGDWVLIEAPSGDDNNARGEPAWLKTERGYTGHDQPGELFNLREDPAERHNRYAEQPQLVSELKALLEKYRRDGRSTPGPVQKNDVEIMPFASRQGGR